MNDDRTLERAARSFIEAGPTRAPEHAVDAALLRIETTKQERGPLIPWRNPTMTLPARLAALAALGALVLAGVALLGGSGGRAPAVTTASPTPSASAPASAAAIASAGPSPTTSSADYSYLPGRILVEHLGNAIDGSEMPTEEYNPDTRRFYFMDPADMTAATAVEFLPGQPASGKFAADVSADGTKVVFQDFVPLDSGGHTSLYEANLDGTGFQRIPIDCTCSLSYPDYDPTATKIVYTRVEGGQSWLEIRDLVSGETTKVESTVGPADDAVPEQPAWSPDGSTIVFSRIDWPEGATPIASTVHYGDVAPTSGVLSLLDIASATVTDLPTGPGIVPGDANWSPDGSTILFAAGPFSTTGSVGASLIHATYSIGLDGAGPSLLNDSVSPEYLPDGQHVLLFNNVFEVARPDGTERRPVNVNGMDLSDLAQGFAYVGHWIHNP